MAIYIGLLEHIELFTLGALAIIFIATGHFALVVRFGLSTICCVAIGSSRVCIICCFRCKSLCDHLTSCPDLTLPCQLTVGSAVATDGPAMWDSSPLGTTGQYCSASAWASSIVSTNRLEGTLILVCTPQPCSLFGPAGTGEAAPFRQGTHLLGNYQVCPVTRLANAPCWAEFSSHHMDVHGKLESVHLHQAPSLHDTYGPANWLRYAVMTSPHCLLSGPPTILVVMEILLLIFIVAVFRFIISGGQ